eukprot:6192177-Pleurochrysis_carterae.AAC.1
MAVEVLLAPLLPDVSTAWVGDHREEFEAALVLSELACRFALEVKLILATILMMVRPSTPMFDKRSEVRALSLSMLFRPMHGGWPWISIICHAALHCPSPWCPVPDE